MRMRQITIARQDWISRSQGGNPMGELKDGTQETGTQGGEPKGGNARWGS